MWKKVYDEIWNLEAVNLIYVLFEAPVFALLMLGLHLKSKVFLLLGLVLLFHAGIFTCSLFKAIKDSFQSSTKMNARMLFRFYKESAKEGCLIGLIYMVIFFTSYMPVYFAFSILAETRYLILGQSVLAIILCYQIITPMILDGHFLRIQEVLFHQSNLCIAINVLRTLWIEAIFLFPYACMIFSITGIPVLLLYCYCYKWMEIKNGAQWKEDEYSR